MSLCDECKAPGHCCKAFYLATREDGTPAVRTAATKEGALAQMAAKGLPFVPVMYAPFQLGAELIDAWLFTCPELLPSGLCGIYEARPQLCRDFEPGSDPLCIHYALESFAP